MIQDWFTVFTHIPLWVWVIIAIIVAGLFAEAHGG